MANSSVSAEYVTLIAQSVGVTNINEDATKQIADDITYRLKNIIQDSQKFMRHAKRDKLNSDDIDHTLKVKNIEPVYGFHAPDFIPFRFSSGGGRELYFSDDDDDSEIELNDAVCQLPMLPLDVSLKAHWLSIEGVQPTVPENPPPVSKDQQKLESIDPASLLNRNTDLWNKKVGRHGHSKHLEIDQRKELVTYELSVEQQLYYNELFRTCVCESNKKREEALHSLRTDSGLHQMLPRITTFISEGVKVNIGQLRLAFLIYIMRMVRALLENKSLNLSRYVHELLPSVVSCIVTKKLCPNPEVDNHYALRDFSAVLANSIAKNFSTSRCNLQAQLTRLYSSVLQDDRFPLSTVYGALTGLAELGPDVIQAFIVPHVKIVGECIKFYLDDPSVTTPGRNDADHILQLLTRVLVCTVKVLPMFLDHIPDIEAEFGCLSTHLCPIIARAKSQYLAASSSSGPSHTVSQAHLLHSNARNPTVVNVPHMVSAVVAPTPSPKYVFVASNSSRPATPRSTVSQSPPLASSSNAAASTVLKIVSTSSSQNVYGNVVTTLAPVTQVFVVQNPATVVASTGKNTVPSVTTQSTVNPLPSVSAQNESQPTVPNVDVAAYVSTPGVMGESE